MHGTTMKYRFEKLPVLYKTRNTLPHSQQTVFICNRSKMEFNIYPHDLFFMNYFDIILTSQLVKPK